MSYAANLFIQAFDVPSPTMGVISLLNMNHSLLRLLVILWTGLGLSYCGLAFFDEGIFCPPFYLQVENPAFGDISIQALGPFFECSGAEDKGWRTLRPFHYEAWDQACGHRELHLLYPLANAQKGPYTESSDFLGIIRSRSSYSCTGAKDHEFMAFPFYFSRDTGCPASSYKGIFPLGGEVKNILSYRRAHWVMFPLSLSLEKPYETRHFMPWPFIQWLEGPQSQGFALWPLFGFFERQGYYEHNYAFWPLIYDFRDDLDQATIRVRTGFLPFYAMESSKRGVSESWVWPFFGYTDLKDPSYYEKRYFWPFFVQGQGEDCCVNRWAPFYTYSSQGTYEKQWFCWPFLKLQRWREGDLFIERSQGLYFLIWHETQSSVKKEQAFYAQKTHFWPFFTYVDNGQGLEQFQLLSPLEVFFPNNEVVRRVYSPLFALFRSQTDVKGYTRTSFLFNMLVFEEDEAQQRFAIGPLLEWKEDDEGAGLEFFMGLLGFKKKKGKMTLKLFWVSLE